MKYQDFIENVRNYISSKLTDGQQIVIQPITKNNGIVYDGLMISDPTRNVTPTIYLNPYYHRYLNGVSMDDIYEDILATYQENLPKEDFDISIFTDFAQASSRIVMRLINRERNQTLLEQVPHIPYMDLAIVFTCLVSDCMDEYASILIYNNHMDLWNIHTDELYSIALENTPHLLPYLFEDIEVLLQELSSEKIPVPDEFNLYLLTNQYKIHGATCILYPKLLAFLAEQLDSNLIIIPSSIHEVLILPETSKTEEYDANDITAMIQDVNETQLPDQEILGDHPYYYDRNIAEVSYYTSNIMDKNE